MQRIAISFAVLFATALPALAAEPAAKPFSADDAFAIDWGVKNCEFKSTDAEHALADAANSKNADAFNKQYAKAFEDKKWTTALAQPDSKTQLCTDLKGQYGPSGTRLPGLIKWQGAPDYTGSSTQTAAPEKKGGHGGSRRQH